jgi:hypothetical protein
MNWRAIYSHIYPLRCTALNQQLKPRFVKGCRQYQVDRLETRLDAVLPEPLRTLMLESDGVQEWYLNEHGDWAEDFFLPWPAEEMIRYNEHFRSAAFQNRYQIDFRNLLIFGRVGTNGFHFGHPIQDDRTCSPQVFVWNPVENSLAERAPDFESFLQDWLLSPESANPNRKATPPSAKPDSKFMSEVLSESKLMRQLPPESRMLKPSKAEASGEVPLSSLFRKPVEPPRPGDSVIVKKGKPIALNGIVENGMVRILDAGVTLPERMPVIIVVAESGERPV